MAKRALQLFFILGLLIGSCSTLLADGPGSPCPPCKLTVPLPGGTSPK